MTTGRGEKQRRRTRGAVLDAAEALFSDSAPSAVRIEDIADRADVSVGTVYGHFGSKDGVRLALAQRLSERATEALAEAFDPSLAPIERVDAAGRVYLRYLLDNPEFLRSVAAEGGSDLPADLVAIADERITVLLRTFEDAIARAAADAGTDVDARLLALFLFTSWNGVALLSLRTAQPRATHEEIEACLTQARRIVVAWLGAPRGEEI